MVKAAVPRALAKRGAIYLIPSPFPGGPDYKFCVLLEDYGPGKFTLIVAFLTTNLDYYHVPTTVMVPAGVVEGSHEPSLLQLENWRLISAHTILKGRAHHKGHLTDELLRQVDDALVHYRDLDDAIWLRMCG